MTEIEDDKFVLQVPKVEKPKSSNSRVHKPAVSSDMEVDQDELSQGTSSSSGFISGQNSDLGKY